MPGQLGSQEAGSQASGSGQTDRAQAGPGPAAAADPLVLAALADVPAGGAFPDDTPLSVQADVLDRAAQRLAEALDAPL